MSNNTTPTPNLEAEAGPFTPASAAASKVSRGSKSFHFKDFDDGKLRDVYAQLGRWEAAASCVRKACNHEDKSECWEQAAVYPIDTRQPSFYLPKVIANLPESLTKNRLQWLYTCLLAKYIRVPIGLSFSAIKPYNNCISYIKRSKKETIEVDAYSLCILYTAGRFIDKHELLINRLGFLKQYPSEHNVGFDWKFEEKRDRIFRRYGENHWEEVTPGAEERAEPSAGPREFTRELKLVYTYFRGITSSEVWSQYQRTVVEAIRNMPSKPYDQDYDELANGEGIGMSQDEEIESQNPFAVDRWLILSPEYIPEEQAAPQTQDEHESLAPIGYSATRVDVPAEETEMNDQASMEGNDGSDNETTGPGNRRQHVQPDTAEPHVAPGIIKTEPADDANESKISTLNGRDVVKKQEEEDVEKKYIPRSQLKAENRALKEEAATRKRKYEETLEALNQQKAQYTKLLHDTKREQDRATKRQKRLHDHIESTYGKPDTQKMLQDESNRLEDGLDPVHACLDRLKESIEEEWAKVRQIKDLSVDFSGSYSLCN